MRLIWAGSFEPEFNRNRKLARLLQLMDADVEVIRIPVWGANRIELASVGKLGGVVRYMLSVPRLLWRLSRSPRPDAYLVSYPGWFDVPVIWLVAKTKGRPIVFDPFISLYDTLVVDRGMYSSTSLVGRMAKFFDRLALRMADVVIADTPGHITYYDSMAPGVSMNGAVLPLGADDSVFRPISNAVIEPRTILFHGTFVPLQGVTTVIEAAHLLDDEEARFVIIGDGQDRSTVDQRVHDLGVQNVDLLGLLTLEELPDHISRATVCLGVFGQSEKAGRVVPNKVYECLAMGRPVITRSSPAIDEALSGEEIVTIPAGDPGALADAIRELLEDANRREGIARAGRIRYVDAFHEDALAMTLERVLTSIEKVRTG